MVLPVPSFNIINGGMHAGNKLDFQEYMIMPVKARSFKEALQIGSEIYQQLKSLLEEKYGHSSINVGDEGGFAPQLSCPEDPFDLIMEAANELGYLRKIKLGIDAAANSFYRNGYYVLEGKNLSSAELLDYYASLAKTYPLVSIEDPFQENAFDKFALLTKKLGKKVQIVGDDLLVTNPERIKKALDYRSCNALLLKLNQIGTVTESLKAARIAMDSKWNVMVSHRSGDTCNAFVADLAVGIGAGQIKSGAPCRGERIAKYNQLLRIEEELGKKAKYAGRIL